MRQKLSITRADRNEELMEFIAIWLAEEGEHSRALRHMAKLLGTTSIACDRRRPLRDVRALVTFPFLHAGRFIPGLSATYCALGAIQEYIALSTYNHLAAHVHNSDCEQVLRRIAVQEAGHMRFYRNAAKIFLSESRTAQVSTSLLLRRLWRPPGMDLLGPEVFEKIFAPLLSDRQYRETLAFADHIIAGLPGMSDVRIMAKYLNSPRILRLEQ